LFASFEWRGRKGLGGERKGREGREGRKEGKPSPCLGVKKPTRKGNGGLCDNFTILPFFFSS